MDIQKLIELIDEALTEANIYVVLYYNGNEKPMLNTKKVLQLLRQELQQHPDSINQRVLRAMHDIGASSVKTFESSELEKAIGKITSMLFYELPGYKGLTPLREDFGKGDPI